ncbi:AAA family ATPase [Candidatus Phytoplasma meliae]|uniref:AAA family ATPase n=1 Tax=Candidatus Phytoplasma meliae TaxID=1848402 RepID=A0ABS5CYT7_9MOLU|nr:ATP-dependent metallopeptidase FtsH/Yme1/Tma family protein [Candidatus Phytoplasma meliae]MBP5836136.1 AAA family ATPase [Candidatus Phytoplasma meliae]MBP5836239.1 AAA family ATPase [Candidatus Phytoplasma meliae]
MKWEPQRFEDEINQQPSQTPQNPIYPFPKSPKRDYLSIIARISTIIVNLFVIFFLMMLMAGAKELHKTLEQTKEKDTNWARDKQYQPSKDGKKLSIDNFVGYDELKTQLKEYIDVVNKKTNKKINEDLPRGILLHGPPGTGKTFLAKCLAGSVCDNAPFFITTGSDFVEKYVGVGALRIRSLFETAFKTAQEKNQKYFFIFIDEIDAVGLKRTGDSHRNSEQTSTLTALLTQMDGFSSNQIPQPIIIAATNRDDVLDEALLREGRLGRKILLDYPDFKTTKDLLQKMLCKNFSNDDQAEKFYKEIATVIHGSNFSPAQIMSLVKEVKKKGSIDQNTIYDAMDLILLGAVKEEEKSNKDKKRTIIHELGHAVIAKSLGFKVHRVTTKSRGKSGGYTIYLPSEDTKFLTKNDLIKKIIIALGGRAAEQENLGDISIGCGDDLNKAYQIARQMVLNFGMSLEDNMKGLNPLKEVPQNVETEKKIENIIDESYKIAKEIIKKQKDIKNIFKDDSEQYQELKNNNNLSDKDFKDITKNDIEIEDNKSQFKDNKLKLK